MGKKFLVQYILAVALVVSACGDDSDDPETATDGSVSTGDAATADGGVAGSCDGLTYDNYAKGLLASNCLVCHGATPLANSIKLDTLANVKTQKASILTHAIEPRQEPKMPQGLPALPVADQAKLKKWLECGAP